MLFTSRCLKCLSTVAVLCSFITLTGCGEQSNVSPKQAVGAQSSVNITGAGASFPALVYTKWSDQYYKDTQAKVNYQSIGSSAGVKQIIAKTVDFGASDAPLKEEQLEKENLFQFPTVIGGVVLAVNIKGIQTNELILNGEVLADIYLGKIKKWNDVAIKKLNPDLSLPDQNMAVVRRADGSGTSFVFTSYLSKVSAGWKEKIGSGSTVEWPYGIGGKGNDGVSALVQQTAGAIGYVEYAYAKQNKLAYTKLVSADGEVVSPTGESFSAAAVSANWQESFAQDLTNSKGANAWPISSTTFIVLHKMQADENKAKEMIKFFDWAYGESAKKMVVDLDYAPLPDSVVSIIREQLAKNITNEQGNPVYQPSK